MKKTRHALALNKQTIANLTPEALVRAAGGMEEADGTGAPIPCSTIPMCVYTSPCTAYQCRTLVSCLACTWPC